jgi:hypothetical protein
MTSLGHLGGRRRHGRRGGQTAEIAHYRRIIASCLANGLSSSNFTQALRFFENGQQLMSAPTNVRAGGVGTSRQSHPSCLAIPENWPRLVLTNNGGAGLLPPLMMSRQYGSA